MVKWKNQDLSMSDQSTATFNVDNEVVLTTTTIYYEGLGSYYKFAIYSTIKLMTSGHEKLEAKKLNKFLIQTGFRN